MSLSCNCKNEVKICICNVERKYWICWVMVDYRLRVGLKLSILFWNFGVNGKKIF